MFLIPAVVATADHPYFLWQAMVQAHEMNRMGWPVTYLVYTEPGSKMSPQLRSLMGMDGVQVWMWKDWRVGAERGYNAAMKPWLVGKWLEAHPEAVQQPFILMDPDVIPTGSMTMPTPSATRWFGTDTDSYTGPGYIRSKGEGLWWDLCAIASPDLDPDSTALFKGIGAQYCAVGQPGAWWCEVAAKSVVAYHHMVGTADQYHPAGQEYPIQAWCSEMYMMQLMMLSVGIEPRISEQMSMVWANGPASAWDSVGFFHDAGVSDPYSDHFCKIRYQSSPFNKDIKVIPESASFKYVSMIHEVEKELPQITWA